MIGEIIKAKGRPTLRVVGQSGDTLVAEPVNTFGSPVRLSDVDAAAYGLRVPRAVDESAALAEADARRTTEANAVYRRANSRKPCKTPDAPGFTPEQAIDAAREPEHEAAATDVARRILANPAKLAAVDGGHVGVHPDVFRALEELRRGDDE